MYDICENIFKKNVIECYRKNCFLIAHIKNNRAVKIR